MTERLALSWRCAWHASGGRCLGMMLASIITQLRRTTVSAPHSVLRTLEAEAERRRVPLATLLREAVEEKARALREGRRPRVGVARSTDGRSAAEVTAEPIADEPR
jgi:hypothetical protein